MKYAEATQITVHITSHIIKETNCIDEVGGHRFEPVSVGHAEYLEILAARPDLKETTGQLWKCLKCDKVKRTS